MSVRQASQFAGADNSGWLAVDIDGDVLRNATTWAAYVYDTEVEAVAASPIGKASSTTDRETPAQYEARVRYNGGRTDTGAQLTYPAAFQALSCGDSYAAYIQESTAEHVALGHYSQEHAMAASLGDLLAGNDGE